MCGIAGCLVAADCPPETQLVSAITRDQHQRGPDNSAVEQASAAGATVVLGHNRLSIIDLSNAANQPMVDAEDTVSIVYNGEIYNYVEIRRELRALGNQFRTESDTEVILEAFKRWGVSSFSRLNGMFAFALFDRRDGRLWLVRDRFGVKPLYYAVKGNSLVFASTPGPIARALHSDPDLGYLSKGLHFWTYEDDSDISPYAGVLAVRAGHYVVASVRKGNQPRLEVRRWYDLEERVAAARDEIGSSSDRDLVERFAELLEDAVSIRLRSDVPVGVSLSGGLDSSAISALMAELGSPPKAFTYGSPSDPRTEGPMVATLARRSNIEVTYAHPGIEEITADFWETLDAQGAPFPDLSIVAQYSVFKAARRERMKVLLGGQGADEALMGYRKFQLLMLRESIRLMDLPKAISLIAGMTLMLRAEVSRMRTYTRQIDRYSRRGGMRVRIGLPAPPPVNMLGDGQLLWERQVTDFRAISLPTLLRYEDRNSMANSLETRLPFLDYRLAELAISLPDALKVRRGFGKWILRDVTHNRIPDGVRLARYKRGFDVSKTHWMSHGLGRSIRGRLEEFRPTIAHLLGGRDTIAGLFSDEQLVKHPAAFAEATTLLWLGQHG